MAQAAVTFAFEKAKEEIGYIWNCSKNVEDLEIEYENLKNMKKRVEDNIKAAEDNGDRLKVGVQEWVAKADTHISEAKEVIDGFEANANKTCFNLGMCMDLGTSYRYGKKAANKDHSPYASLTKHQKDGQTFEAGVSAPTRACGVLDFYERQNIVDLDTHKRCFKNILEFIQDDNIQIIGIYGMGGVGKTTLAKEVALEVKSSDDERIKKEVEFITVSQPVDVERIKKEVEEAAKRIYNGEKILVILDDVWEKLKLDEVGIPCGDRYKNCKILLTSRSEDVCKTMNATGLINVGSLKPEEAWILFKSVVDTVETDENLKKIAEKVVDGCGGLPLIIQAVGAALKNESIESWKRALTQLQKRTTSYIDPNIRLAYSHLQLSYDFLQSEEAKSCFLLCSMFPEDYDIPLENLAYYGVGLEIFEDLDSMEDARNRVRHAVKILKSTCLLLDGFNESRVKMHDVVREVALLIASKGSNKFLVKAGIGLEEWQPRTKRVRNCTGISLMRNSIKELPDYELEIPRLDIFLIQGNFYLSTIPDNFILGVKEARVLDFKGNRIVSLPPSLKQLTKLCMLNLGENSSLRDISILGDLKSLEILILSHTGIVEIPLEIGDLVNLRRLEVKDCPGLSHIAPGVMSKLRWLEELHIAYFPVEDGNNEGFMEIGALSMLTFLDLFVPHIRLLPVGVCFRKLKGFVIQIGGDLPKYIAAIPDNFILGVKEARVLDIEENEIVSLPPSLKQLSVGGNSSHRDVSILGHLKSVEILILSHTGIVEIPQEIGDLVNLRRLEVKGCQRLSHIAPGVISKLRWLKELHIDCLVKDGNYESLVEIGILSVLTFLDLFVPHIHLVPTEGVCLRRLKGFIIQIGGDSKYKAAKDVHKKILILGMKDLDESSMLEVKELIKLSDGIIFYRVMNPDIVPTMYCESLDDSTTIMLSECDNLLCLVDSSDSDAGDELNVEKNTKKQFFPKLEYLFLCRLDMLHNCPCRYISLKNLVTLQISHCNKLGRLFSINEARGLVNLQTLKIMKCWSLEEVIWDGDEGGIDMVVFHCLVKLELLYLDNLKNFYAGKVIIRCPSFVKVEVKGCNEMEPYDTPDLKLVNQIN